VVNFRAHDKIVGLYFTLVLKCLASLRGTDVAVSMSKRVARQLMEGTLQCDVHSSYIHFAHYVVFEFQTFSFIYRFFVCMVLSLLRTD